MRMNSTHAVSAMRFKNHGELCPELKTVSVTIKPLLVDIDHLHEIKNKSRKKWLIDVSLKHQFVLTELNTRVTRSEYMGEDYVGNA